MIAIHDDTVVFLAFDVSELLNKVNKFPLEFTGVNATDEVGIDNGFFVDGTQLVEDLAHKVIQGGTIGSGQYIGCKWIESAHYFMSL
jgi:hypothetical protein